MSNPDQVTPPNSSSRPACMPSNKEDGFLPPINLRGTPSSDSDADSRRDQNGRLLLSNENSSLTPSPVKFPTIGRSISSSVSSLTSNRSNKLRDKESRALLCRSPSCPSNIGSVIDRHDISPEGKRAQDDNDVKLPSIFQDCKSTTASYMTPRNTRRNKLADQNGQLKPRDPSPGNHIAERNAMKLNKDQVSTPRDDGSLETHRSTQCALLLPLRNTETRKSKRKRKKGHDRQKTLLNEKSDSAAYEENSAKDVPMPSSQSDCNSYSPVSELDGRVISETDDVNSDKSSESNSMHPTYHVTKHSNKHQIMTKLKA